MIDSNHEIKLRAFELAERTVSGSNYNQSGGGLVGGGIRYLDKDMREITMRADRILAWVTGTEEADKSTLISKLRAVLCEPTP